MSVSTRLTGNESYRLLVDGIIDYAIYLLGCDGTVESWNAGAERMKGYRAEEIVGRKFATFYTPADIATGEPWRALGIARDHGKFEGEGWRVRKDGSRFWASVVIDALRSADGELVGFAKVTRDVTERTIKEEQRQIIVDAAPNGMLVIDGTGTITFANALAERIMAAPAGALAGIPLQTLLTVDNQPTLDIVLQCALRASAARFDGRTLPVEVTFNAAPTARGRVIVASIVDITDRLRIEDESRRSEAAVVRANRLMTMAEEIAHYGHWRIDLRTHDVYWSDELYRTRGLPKTHDPSREASLAKDDPDGLNVGAIIRRASVDGTPFEYETRLLGPTGMRDAKVAGRGEFDADGSLIAIVGIFQDITDLKTAERERDRLIERLTLATQAGKIGIWEWDSGSDAMVWDSHMFALYGVDANTTVATYGLWTEALLPSDHDRVVGEIGAAVAGIAPFDAEFRVRWPNGEVHTIRAQAAIIRNATENSVRLIGTHWDITEVRSLAEQLREEKERQLAYERDRLYEHERKWSTTFQRAVLPLSLPNVAGCEFDAVYEPGLGDAQVGGDWYDAVRLIDGRILVSIGDVAGSGLEAAVVVGVVRQIMRGIAQLHANPMLILDAADRALSLEYPGVYVTAWVGIVDLVTRTITYASAGHPPPLIVATNGDIRELSDTTLPIGLREGHQGQASTVSLADGDLLVLYTDGVTEASRDILAGTLLLRDAAAALAGTQRSDPAHYIKGRVIPDGSRDDVAILVLRISLAQAEHQIERWRFDVRDMEAATVARKRFVKSLEAQRFSPDDVGNAELIFGELVGNVVRHAGDTRGVDIVIDHSGSRTVLHVLDRGAGFRHIGRLPVDPYAENGRGLFLIAALSAEFTVTERPNGGSHARVVLIDHVAQPLREDR